MINRTCSVVHLDDVVSLTGTRSVYNISAEFDSGDDSRIILQGIIEGGRTKTPTTHEKISEDRVHQDQSGRKRLKKSDTPDARRIEFFAEDMFQEVLTEEMNSLTS